MLVGTAEDLADALAGSSWGVDIDYGTAWTLDDQPGWSLHLRTTDPDDDHQPGVLYAQRRHASHGLGGAVLTPAITQARTEALLAVVDGGGDLRDLARVLSSAGPDRSA